MILLRKNLWQLEVHTLNFWKKEFRDKNRPPVIPYFKFNHKLLSYGIFTKHGKSYFAKGHYFFPFAVRTFEEIPNDIQLIEGYNYIVKQKGVCGERPIILGTRLEPNFIVGYGTIEEVKKDFNLRKYQIDEAIKYFKENN